MKFFPHPDKFRPLYERLLTTWNTLGAALDPLEETIEDLKSEAPNAVVVGMYDDARKAYDSWEEAIRLVHWQVLQACHEHCVELPLWLEHALDNYEPEFPELPFRCDCGLSHHWEYTPDYLLPEDDDTTSKTNRQETS